MLFHTAGDPQLQTITEDIYDEFVHFRRYKNSMLDSLLSTFFVLLLRKHDKDVSIPGAHENLDNENVIFIIQYMQKHFNTITLSELASFFNYSERQIERIIIGATGRNFQQNIRTIRMHKAAHLLTTTSLPVQKIAEQTGFYDASHFRRAFRQFYGTTPGEYRRF
ncbi:MAG: helix-turn-helix domain-containing protein [Bilifractor sp.]